VRILGIDPGLTRCGIAIIDISATRAISLAHVGVLQTPSTMPLAQRLLSIQSGLKAVIAAHKPDRLALERVFAQHNVRTVMGTAQVSGVVLAEAAASGLAIDLHTPSEVKAAVTGSGRANKQQVANMVGKIVSLPEGKLLPDATDAVAIAICNAWRGGSGVIASVDTRGDGVLTPAQLKWREAERHSRKRG
jgi:crossover junction endodeoxyribonuclease RuvC